MKKKDIILLVSVLAACAIAALVLFALRSGEGSYIEITIDGELYGSYSLSEDRTIEIETEYGRNVVEISGGAARMIEADCPDGYCEDMGSVQNNNQTIVCLPHKLVVTVVSEETDEYDIDAISQ